VLLPITTHIALHAPPSTRLLGFRTVVCQHTCLHCCLQPTHTLPTHRTQLLAHSYVCCGVLSRLDVTSSPLVAGGLVVHIGRHCLNLIVIKGALPGCDASSSGGSPGAARAEQAQGQSQRVTLCPTVLAAQSGMG
jgi:hypothetical protein